MGKLAECIKRWKDGMKDLKHSSPTRRKNADKTVKQEFNKMMELILDDNYKEDDEDTKEWNDLNA